VAGPHLDVVREREEVVAQAGEEALGAAEAGVDEAGRLVEQVGAADVADEHEVAGEEEAGMLGGGAVGHEERQVLRRVARGVDGLQADVADPDLAAVVELHPVEAVLPIVVALVGEVEGRAGALGELAAAGLVVGVDVRFGDGGDAHAVVLGEADEGVDVAAGVDDDGLAGGLAADEVAALGEVLVVDGLKQHGGSLRQPETNTPIGYASSASVPRPPAGVARGRRRAVRGE
jgi:hypothetical protein